MGAIAGLTINCLSHPKDAANVLRGAARRYGLVRIVCIAAQILDRVTVVVETHGAPDQPFLLDRIGMRIAMQGE